MTAVKPTGKEEHTAAWEKERRGRRKGVNGGVLLAMFGRAKALAKLERKEDLSRQGDLCWIGFAGRGLTHATSCRAAPWR
jgi:hypothetical protein